MCTIITEILKLNKLGLSYLYAVVFYDEASTENIVHTDIHYVYRDTLQTKDKLSLHYRLP